MLSTKTRILIRWARGLIAVGTDGPSQFVEMAGVQDYEQARKLGEDLLAAHRVQRGTKAVTGQVWEPHQQPAGGFFLRDELDGMVVQSIAINMADEGQTMVTPGLGDPRERALAIMERRIAKANAGTTSEFAIPGAPRQETGDRVDSSPPVFSYTWQSNGAPA